MSLTIISGGQTGADRAGLEAARICGLKTGGYAPKNWMTENGSDPSLKDFGLIEASSNNYVERNKLNIDHSDLVLAFRFHSSLGTDKSIGYARTKKWISQFESSDTGYRPVLVINDFDQQNLERAFKFITLLNPRIINIVGHRESSAGIENFGEKVRDFLITLFNRLKNNGN